MRNFAAILMLFLMASSVVGQDSMIELKGTILNSATEKPLESVIVNLKGTNISTVTNSEGIFNLKIENNNQSETLVITLIGFRSKELPITSFKNSNLEVMLDENVMELSEVNLTAYKDPGLLVRKIFKEKSKNSQNETVLMTAFYRETIKRRNTNVSLTEAVVDLYKKPYASNQKDEMKLHKARKSTNYKRLDTLSFKLQGGPFSTLYLDIMKYPEYIFTEESIEDYDYTFDKPTSVNNRPVYVVQFKQKEFITSLGYSGTLYIDVASVALISASYNLDLDGNKAADDFLVEKKPRDVVVSPTEAIYKVNYREKDGKWLYGYGSVNLTFKVNKKGKIFNQLYSVASEMAITDWTISTAEKPVTNKERLRPNMVLADRISGFSDPDFWGRYNLIEPEKSIENAIDKIKRKMKRTDSGMP